MSARDDAAWNPVRLPAEAWAAESPFIGEADEEEQARIDPWYQAYTPFVEGREEMYAPEAEWETELAALEAESPFQGVFEPEELEEELVEEQERAYADDHAFH